MITQAQDAGRMAWFISLLATLALIFLVACGQKSESPQPPASAASATAQSDPVTSLKVHVEHLKSDYSAQENVGSETLRNHLLSVTYDVQKSDSLVSPYMGFINTAHYMGVVTVATHETRYTLAFQEGRWILKGVQNRVLINGGDIHSKSGWQDSLEQQGNDREHWLDFFRQRLGLAQ